MGEEFLQSTAAGDWEEIVDPLFEELIAMEFVEPFEEKVKGDFNDEKSLLQLALCFYSNFKGLFFGGVSYSHEQRQFTRNIFLKRISRDAFKLADVELSFMLKDLHTKTGTPHLDGNPVACIMTLLLISAAAFLFYKWSNPAAVSSFVYEDYNYGGLLTDIGISYALVFGALILEMVSLLMALLSGQNVTAFNY
ncbi:hypothetical protein RHMOL_Rhmol07G0050300 [Rhododendron molle]|uniref:Uncharacterized protein n=1 Tax=Rhododendron molle TaxID=49168 RepID=A0ACC0MZ53_RHOML|nr:hypothetical protein RHMOL_Rhmol07G0050300 [Rhododendron molle]